MAAETSILIVGGSLNGLTTAVLLSHLGVPCTVVERHPATTVQYKFRGISPRSMEVYRSVGLEEAIRAHRTGDQKFGEIARARNLADPEPQFMGIAWDTAGLSMVTAETCDQDRLEPLLRAQAERLGAEVRFHTELVSFEQDDQGVRALIRNLGTGSEETVTADYLVAADGVASGTRERLGVRRQGPGVLQHWMNLIFSTDLQPFLQGRRMTACFVTDVNGSIVPREDRWLLAIQYQAELGERPEDFNQERTAELVRRAAGRSDVRVELFDARDWTVAGYVAERYQVGRAFLVGDAAHGIPPTGGFGGNTGIHDCHNLAWKLAFVLSGKAGPGLLETYDAERRFVAERTLAQALARLAAWYRDLGHRLPPPVPVLDDLAVIFGQIYPSGALIPDQARLPELGFEDPRAPSGRPGTRAPHLLVERAGARSGIHDFFGRTFVLLTRSAAWADAARGAGRGPSARLAALRLVPGQGATAAGADATDLEGRFEQAYRVGAEGAVLVRPDGIIAWRAAELLPNPEEALVAAMARVCSDSSAPGE